MGNPRRRIRKRKLNVRLVFSDLTAGIRHPESGSQAIHVAYTRSLSFNDYSPETGGAATGCSVGSSTDIVSDVVSVACVVVTEARNSTKRFISYAPTNPRHAPIPKPNSSIPMPRFAGRPESVNTLPQAVQLTCFPVQTKSPSHFKQRSEAGIGYFP